ncbi:hypothetical protein BD779DRAFT_1508913 [Infundibulicybe gibba]|nr:hypothetical protein BD779DRAFT_1508913 [Infundibulicybe gibba]
MSACSKHATPLAWARAPHRARSIAEHRPSGQSATRESTSIWRRGHRGTPSGGGCSARMNAAVSGGTSE